MHRRMVERVCRVVLCAGVEVALLRRCAKIPPCGRYESRALPCMKYTLRVYEIPGLAAGDDKQKTPPGGGVLCLSQKDA